MKRSKLQIDKDILADTLINLSDEDDTIAYYLNFIVDKLDKKQRDSLYNQLAKYNESDLLIAEEMNK